MIVVAKGWGHELWIENNDKYCGKQLTVLPGKWCSVHYHKLKDETFYVIDGELLLEYAGLIPKTGYTHDLWWTIDKKKIVLKKGDSFRIRTDSMHRFTSNTNTPCTFIEFSTTHSDEDSYRVIKGD